AVPGRCVRGRAADALPRARLADRHDRRGAAVLGAHVPAPTARRPWRTPARARPRRAALATPVAHPCRPPAARAGASARGAPALGGELRRLAPARAVRRGSTERRHPRATALALPRARDADVGRARRAGTRPGLVHG